MTTRNTDPRFASLPAQPGIEQLRWYIRQTAAGAVTVHEFLNDFRAVHEAAEKAGGARYASEEEARAVWDALWAVEFCVGTAPRPEGDPDERMIPEEVLVTVKRAALHLAG
jgi:hypothetical protein